MPGGVVWHPLGLCAGDGHRPRIRCPQLWFWEGMEENRIHSLFLSSSFKCEDGAQRQMPPLRGPWAQTAWAASYRWSPASEDACWGRGFLIWKGEATVLTPWHCAGDTPPVRRQESTSQQRQSQLGGAMGTRSQSELCSRLAPWFPGIRVGKVQWGLWGGGGPRLGLGVLPPPRDVL